MHVHALESKGNNIRAAVIGLLIVFVGAIVVELWQEPWYLFGAIIAAGLALLLAKKVGEHFHGAHTHAGDSAIDIVGPIVLFLANIFHPAIDGFSFYETLVREGNIAGVILGGSIVIHEIFRQSALITGFRAMGIRWGWVIVTALFGIFAGIGAGVLGSSILERHEGLINIAALFAYIFIIGEFHYTGHGVSKKSGLFVVAGIIVGIALTMFLKTH